VRSLTATAPAVESPPEATPAVPAPLGPDPIEAGERVEK
jgi:hypothetical protein